MLTNFVSVLGILLVAAFVVMGIYFLVERIGGYFAMKEQEETYRSQHNYVKYTPYNYVRPGSIPSSSFCVKCSREATLYDLNRRLTELEQFYTIDNDDDESLVDIVKNLREDVNDILSSIKLHYDLIKQLYSDRDEDVNKIADQINRLDDIVSNKSEEESDVANLDA